MEMQRRRVSEYGPDTTKRSNTGGKEIVSVVMCFVATFSTIQRALRCLHTYRHAKDRGKGGRGQGGEGGWWYSGGSGGGGPVSTLG
ncbi:hypothetical protein E2C01_091465 [Portunus trituberculatus]|uniref:Uncharacterized protein n=1 Tax=Portunus trituberculatus TaxID=210409 RepID=A0A5B7JE12_PORTR|nr:hypothetical protein [Portunus trituberculatus]